MKITKYIFIVSALIIVAGLVCGCKKDCGRAGAPIVETHPDFIEISDKTEAFYKGYFQVVGRGSGESQDMAMLAARAVAQARLVEIINGIEVERQSMVESGKLKSDVVKLSSKGLVRFAYVCGQRFYPESNTAEVCMRLSLRSGGFGDVVEHLIEDVK